MNAIREVIEGTALATLNHVRFAIHPDPETSEHHLPHQAMWFTVMLTVLLMMFSALVVARIYFLLVPARAESQNTSQPLVGRSASRSRQASVPPCRGRSHRRLCPPSTFTRSRRPRTEAPMRGVRPRTSAMFRFTGLIQKHARGLFAAGEGRGQERSHSLRVRRIDVGALREEPGHR